MDLKIYALIGTTDHDPEFIHPGYSLFIRARDSNEQQALMREIALAVSGDVVKLSNGLYMIVTAVR